MRGGIRANPFLLLREKTQPAPCQTSSLSTRVPVGDLFSYFNYKFYYLYFNLHSCLVGSGYRNAERARRRCSMVWASGKSGFLASANAVHGTIRSRRRKLRPSRRKRQRSQIQKMSGD